MPLSKYLILLYYCLLNFTLTAQEIPTESLILHFNFNNNQLNDESPKGHGFINHNLAFDKGINDSGLLLNGTDAFLEIPHSNQLEIKETITTSLWYKHEPQETSAFYSLIEQSANEFGGHSRYGTWVFDKQKVMTCIEPDACPNGGQLCQRCIVASEFLEAGKWYHIVSVYTGETLQIFINGIQRANQTFNVGTGISTRPYPLTIGTDMYDGSPVYLKGIIDEVRIYDTHLNNSQIEALFEEFTVTTSLKVTEPLPFSIFPNPSTHYLRVESNYANGQFIIQNTLGQIVQKGQLATNNVINVQHLEAGMYFFQYTDGIRLSSKPIFIKK